MIWIGLTGGIASGKSTAANILRRLGYAVIDADEVARFVVQAGSEGLKKVALAFGPGILKPDQSLDRKKLAAEVFKNPRELQKLESILHPLIKVEVQKLKQAEEKKGTRICFYDVPLLFEKKMQQDFAKIILISCSETIQKQRLKERDGLSEKEIQERLKNQIPLVEKEKLVNFIIHNETTLQDLEKALLQICEKL